MKEYNSKQWAIEMMCKNIEGTGSSYYHKQRSGGHNENEIEWSWMKNQYIFAAKDTMEVPGC